MVSFCQFLLLPLFPQGSLFLTTPLFQHGLSVGHSLAGLPVSTPQCGQPTDRPQSLRATVLPLAGSTCPAMSPAISLSMSPLLSPPFSLEMCLFAFLFEYMCLYKLYLYHNHNFNTHGLETQPFLSDTGVIFVQWTQTLSKSPPLAPGN